MKKAAFHTLGCKVNAYETEAMQQLLEQAGYEIVPFAQAADVYIINTCSVTNIADRKSRQMLHRAKKQNPCAVVVAVGCYVQSAKEQLSKDESIDLLIGNNKKQDLVEILQGYFKDQSQREAVLEIGETRLYEELKISRIADHTRAFIKVQDGCNQFCSYCIIPYTRGRVRSRQPKEVLAEVEQLALAGYQEVVLTGIHLSSYGIDLEQDKEENLLSLLVALHQVEGISRIRLGSLEPRIITPDFVKTLAGLKKICPHFHLSLQSGCDQTLVRMNRRYTAEEYRNACELLRAAFDNPAITTDVIVGFPGESDQEFAVTREFLRQVQFYEMHIFKYSRREGTKAADMENQISDHIKAKRSEQLLTLADQMSKNYRDSMMGSTVDVLWEEDCQVEGKQYMTGYTKEYVKVAIPFSEGLKNKISTGMIKAYLTDEIMALEEI